MDLKERHERAIGDYVLGEINRTRGTGYGFASRLGEAPDLLYRDGADELRVEVTCAYYDSDDAKLQWDLARMKCAEGEWFGMEADDTLVESINEQLRRKSEKRYGANCILIVYVNPATTSGDELLDRLKDVTVPPRHSFDEIYLAGCFGESSLGSPGGMRCWQLFSRQA